MEMQTYQNPVISGFNPDPSICRVGEDFYLVTSSFEFFPGVPIYHSKNLVNWELINYCLTDEEQLRLKGCGPSDGIYAPTLRYWDGVWFMTVTNISDKGNFIVHTRDIRGKWSAPGWVDQKGIDPSLYFERSLCGHGEDGAPMYEDRAYFCSNGGEEGPGIYLCQVNPFTGERLSASRKISAGCGGKAPEAPHIYRIGEYYYLMMAEGGTEYGHGITMQRSRDIYGPYEACPYNPVLTHRDAGGDPIQAVGHGDLTEDQNGNWWVVCLGIRPLEGSMLHNLGRETFLAPVVWEDGWPVIGNNGRIAGQMQGPLPGMALPADRGFSDDFRDGLRLQWNTLRNHRAEDFQAENGTLRIRGNEEDLDAFCGSPSFLGVRQPQFCVRAKTEVFVPRTDKTKAGMTAFYNGHFHYEIYVEKGEGGAYVNVRRRLFDLEMVTARAAVSEEGSLELKIEADEDYYFFFYRTGENWVLLDRGMTRGLTTEITDTRSFTGVFIGLFAVEGEAKFRGFSLEER